jgi:hypothetical protein
MAQGRWAEDKAIQTINNHPSLRAIRYGQSRISFVGKEQFLEYWLKLHEQVQTYGKRPDVLIFRKEDDLNCPDDISERDEEEVMKIVEKAIAGLECRSSTWILEKYRKARGILKKDLNFTVKEEDLEVLNRWRKTYNGKKVYYVQLFFDSSFALLLDRIMHLLQHGAKGKDYALKIDRKTGKNTYFVPVSKGIIFADCLEMPTLDCETLIDEIGQVMAIRTPKGGKYVLSEEFVHEILR